MIRRRITFANVVATVALVFAMAGGAFAASGISRPTAAHKKGVAARSAGKKSGKYVITSTGQIKPNVVQSLRGQRGPAGANGATGPAGTQGLKGEQGLAGKNGTNGSNGVNGTKGDKGEPGESVTVTELAKGSALCSEGGVEVSNGSGAGHACNGSAAGGGGYVEKLPSGKTEAGLWNLSSTNASDEGNIAITFSLPVAIPAGHIKFFKESSGGTTECKGEAEKPSAEPGYLCIYTESEGNGPALSGNVGTIATGLGDIGAYWKMTAAGATAYAYGSWAVTAE
jgi:hypothetical protein